MSLHQLMMKLYIRNVWVTKELVDLYWSAPLIVIWDALVGQKFKHFHTMRVQNKILLDKKYLLYDSESGYPHFKRLIISKKKKKKDFWSCHCQIWERAEKNCFAITQLTSISVCKLSCGVIIHIVFLIFMQVPQSCMIQEWLSWRSWRLRSCMVLSYMLQVWKRRNLLREGLIAQLFSGLGEDRGLQKNSITFQTSLVDIMLMHAVMVLNFIEKRVGCTSCFKSCAMVISICLTAWPKPIATFYCHGLFSRLLFFLSLFSKMIIKFRTSCVWT